MQQSKPRPRRLRYTKAALLAFGFGLVLGFVVVVGEFPYFDRVASIVMAAALLLLPAALFADGHGMALFGWIAVRLSRKKRPKARARTKARPAGAGRKPPARKATRAPRPKRS